MPDRPRVAIITPTLGRRPDLLREMFASVASQDLRVRHLVVAPIEAVAAGAFAAFPHVELVPDPGRGLYGAINAGIQEVNDQDFLLVLNDDDLLRPHTLGLLVDLLDRNQDAVIALGGTDLINLKGNQIARFARTKVTVSFVRWGPGTLFLPSCLFRTRALRAVSLFDESLAHAADLDMIIRLLNTGFAVTCSTSTSAFRWHSSSLTVRDHKASRAEAEVVRQRHLRGLASIAYRVWRPTAAAATVVGKLLVTRRAERAVS